MQRGVLDDCRGDAEGVGTQRVWGCRDAGGVLSSAREDWIPQLLSLSLRQRPARMMSQMGSARKPKAGQQ
jgi:hypothetical protein